MRPPRPQPPWRRFKSPFISSAVKGSPAGTPSIIAVKRGPCDSPAVKYLILFLQIRFHLFKWYLIDGCTPQFRNTDCLNHVYASLLVMFYSIIKLINLPRLVIRWQAKFLAHVLNSLGNALWHQAFFLSHTRDLHHTNRDCFTVHDFTITSGCFNRMTNGMTKIKVKADTII